MLVSIIMRTPLSAGVVDTLLSIKVQCHTAWELLIVGNPAVVADAVTESGIEDGAVRFFSEDLTHVADVVRQCRGDLIAFAEAGDIWFVHRLRELVAAAEHSKVVVDNGLIKEGDELEDVLPYCIGDDFEQTLAENWKGVRLTMLAGLDVPEVLRWNVFSQSLLLSKLISEYKADFIPSPWYTAADLKLGLSTQGAVVSMQREIDDIQSWLVSESGIASLVVQEQIMENLSAIRKGLLF